MYIQYALVMGTLPRGILLHVQMTPVSLERAEPPFQLRRRGRGFGAMTNHSPVHNMACSSQYANKCSIGRGTQRSFGPPHWLEYPALSRSTLLLSLTGRTCCHTQVEADSLRNVRPLTLRRSVHCSALRADRGSRSLTCTCGVSAVARTHFVELDMAHATSALLTLSTFVFVCSTGILLPPVTA